MKILFLGDISGRSGRDGVARELPQLRQKYAPDVVIVNGENAAAGRGITFKLAAELFEMGISCITTGNHVFRQRELLSGLDREPRLLRPLNYPEGTAGRGFFIHSLPDGRKILIVNVMARLFMDVVLDDPFAATERLLAQYPLGRVVQAVFIDFHGEATSEKNAFGQVFDGRASAVIGTHTHIPTADERILKKGTAFQTDTGMCGDFDSVIGMKKEEPIWRFVRQTPSERFVVADGEATLCGVFIETNDATGLAQKIERVQVGGMLKQSLR